MRALDDRGAAEDVVQETLLRAWRARDRHRPARGSLRTWLFAIAKNVIRDAFRARASRPVVVGEPAESTIGATDLADGVLRSFEVEEAIRTLSDEHRHVIVELHLLGRPCADVARELGVPEGTVRSRHFYALKALRAFLVENGWADD